MNQLEASVVDIQVPLSRISGVPHPIRNFSHAEKFPVSSPGNVTLSKPLEFCWREVNFCYRFPTLGHENENSI